MDEFTIPECVYKKVREMGFVPCSAAMKDHISRWRAVTRANGEFWDYTERDGDTVYRVHRKTVHPAQRVSDEWASLILNDDTLISTDDETCTEWLSDYLEHVNFTGKGQECISDAFALGTAGWLLWVDTEKRRMIPRKYDARMIMPLSWDDDGITECGFVSVVHQKGKPNVQLQVCRIMEGTYHIETYLFQDGQPVPLPEGWLDDFDTESDLKPFAIIRPAIPNRYVDFSPYGQAVFADHIDIMHSVDAAYDAVFNEVDLAKMRVFVSDMLLERGDNEAGNRKVIPFGKQDMTVYRKVSSTDDVIKEFAPSMRTDAQISSYRLAVQSMGDACGFGSQYFDVDKSGGIRTAHEVSSDNSALMRNIRRHENLIGGEIESLAHAMLHFAREFLGVSLPDEGVVRISFDDSIITDTMAEKQQDLAEVGTTLNAWEFRRKWYGEDEETAKANVPQSGFMPEPFEE